MYELHCDCTCVFVYVLVGNNHPRDYQIDIPGIKHQQDIWIAQHKKKFCFKKVEFRYRQIIYNTIYKDDPLWSKFWSVSTTEPLQVEQGEEDDEEQEKEQQQIDGCVADLPYSTSSSSSCSTGDGPVAEVVQNCNPNEEKKLELHNDGSVAGSPLPYSQQLTVGANQEDDVQNCDQEDSNVLEILLNDDHFLMLAHMNAFVECFDDVDKSDLSPAQMRQLRFQREFFRSFVHSSLHSIRADAPGHFFFMLSYQLVVGWTGVKVQSIVPPAETLPAGTLPMESVTCEHIESSLTATRFLHQTFTQICEGSVRFRIITNCGICQKRAAFGSLLETQVYARALIPLQHTTVPFIAGSQYSLPDQNTFPVEFVDVPVGSVCLLDPKLHFFISSNQFLFSRVILTEN